MENKIEEIKEEIFKAEEEFMSKGKPVLDIESYVAEHLAKQGYRKQVQGEWREQNDGTHYCSNCGHDATQNYEGREICGIACAYCGAKMKGN